MKTIKIKVIDLINMMSNGNIPKKIIYDGYVYQWNNIIKNYEREVDIDTTLNWDYIAIQCLNEEVEILEEKKIPGIIHWHEENGVGNDDDAFYVDVNDKSQYVDSEYDSWEMTVILKINEIIDYLESKEKGE